MSYSTFKDVKTVEALGSILSFNDNEVKLFENIRSSLVARTKFDREYINNLNKYVLIPSTKNLNGFIVEDCWNVFQDEVFNVNTSFMNSCDDLVQKTIPKLNAIIKEKVEAKKRFIDEKFKLDLYVKKVKDSVDRAKSEYHDNLTKVNQSKHKYMETLQSPKKNEESLKKLLKQAAALYDSHNNYVAILNEYNSICEAHTQSLLPNLLNSYQTIQERLLEEFKQVMNEYFDHINFAKSSIQEMFNKISTNIAKISPSFDYRTKYPPAKNYTVGNQSLWETPLSFEERNLNVLLIDNLLQPPLVASQFAVVTSTIAELNKKRSNYKGEANHLDVKLVGITNQITNLQNDPVTNLNKSIRMIMLNREKLDTEVFKNTSNNLMKQIENLNLDASNPYENIGVKGSSMANVSKTGSIDIDRNSIRSSKLFAKMENQYENGKISELLAKSKQPTNNDNNPTAQVFDHNLELKNQPWFHGLLPRDDTNYLLKANGEFLIRETDKTSKVNRTTNKVVTPYVISVRWNEELKHFIIMQDPETKKYGVDQADYNKVSELVQALVNSNQPISEKSGAYLKTPINKITDIKHSDITVGEKIGSGQFGIVYKGLYKGRDVAIKSCNEELSEDEKRKFVAEGKILEKYSHKNIVRFIGIAIDDRFPIYILMELVNGGSLLSYLKRNNNNDKLPTNKKLKLCQDCAEGMEYLEKNGVIHRDLAARNCLIDEKAFILKLSDFGLSKQLEEDEEIYEIKHSKQIPIRWSAIELFTEMSVSSKSDIWSYGVTIWEIFTYGNLPYGLQYTNKDVREFVIKGGRLECPADCPEDVYKQLMLNCWSRSPNERPNFTQILDSVKKLLS